VEINVRPHGKARQGGVVAPCRLSGRFEVATLAGVAYVHNRILVGAYSLLGASPCMRAGAVAGKLRVSVRTLHRVLADAGLGFVQVRAIAVAEALTRLETEQRGLPRAALAHQLGFPSERALDAFLARNARYSRPATPAPGAPGRPRRIGRMCDR